MSDVYAVIPKPREEHGPSEEWWTVTLNGAPHRHFADRARAERYATDPAFRAEIRSRETPLHKLAKT